MQIERLCKQCGTPLSDDKKLGAQYCNHSCSQGYYKRRRRILDQIGKVEQEIKSNEDWLKELEEESDTHESEKADLNKIENSIEVEQKRVNTLNHLLSLSKPAFQKSLGKYLDRHMDKFGDDYGMFMYGDDPEAKERISVFHKDRFNKMRESANEKIKSLKKELGVEKGKNLMSGFDQILIMDKSKKINAEIAELNKKLTELKVIDLDNLPVKFNPKKVSSTDRTKEKRKPLVKGVSGREILDMTFNNLELEGELGLFLGLLQRNKCAIALTGDSGAGKTTFSFQLAKGFRNANQSVGYFSLESGITETTQELIENLDLADSKFEVFGEGKLEDVRIQADRFDCIIVDSYAKISSKADDFESLRQDFPDTFFIIIFQKTTDGKIRGGSSILYNSTATIDIRLTKGNHRIAFMQKSRYGTENFVYSISQDKLLKNWKSPIKWTEIEERWPSPHHH